jgi:DNA helicase-2/ATP-dependent DNA helicase PcrA
MIPKINFEAELNEEQYAAVTAKDGPSLVLAGAGSGKTRTLTYRVAWLLERGVKPWEILLITFTNKAAKEMLHRVESLTGVLGHYFWGGTFHHIAQKKLRMHGAILNLNKQFTILDASDADSFINETVRICDPLFFKNKENPKASVINEVFSYARNTLQSLTKVVDSKYPYLSHLQERLDQFYKSYKSRKLQNQVVDYDDLLDLWLQLLEEDAHVRGIYQDRFNYILVDEYQDTNGLQSKIIDTLASRHQIMAVGDDAQCIYTWRGANFENILTFPDRHPGTVIHKIQTNYRSTPQILKLANEVLQTRPTNLSYSKVLQAVRGHKQKPYFVPVMDTRQQAQFVIKRIEALADEGYPLSEIAVLYRAHYHAMDLQIELSRLGVSYQITSGIRFFEQAHIKDIIALLRFVNNPNDNMAFYRFVMLLPKVGEKVAAKILEQARNEAKQGRISLFKAFNTESVIKKVPETARETWQDIVYVMMDIQENIGKETPSKLIEIAVEGWYGDYLRTLYTNWTSRRDDLDSLVTFAGRYSELPDLLAQLVLLSSEMNDRNMQSNEVNLRLSTIHQAKGLEFGVVFIIGLGDGLFPSKRSIESGDLDEELRLFYVAVTRAKDELYLLYPKLIMQGNAPMLFPASRFVSQLPEDTYTVLHTQRLY